MTLDKVAYRNPFGNKALVPALLVWLVPFIHGCASVTPQAKLSELVVVPAAWSVDTAAAATNASSLAHWWLRFNDPQLAGLVAKALQANPSVKTAEAALLRARALRDVAAAGLYPALGSSASAQRSKTGDAKATNNFNAGLDASWELDIFGGNRSALGASEADARASASSLGNVQVSIAAEVALDYISLRGAQARLAVAKRSLASQQETLQITQWRQQAGLVTALEAEQARTAVEQANAQLPVLQTTIEQTQHALAVLIGQPPMALAEMLASDKPVPQAADALVLSIPAETLRQRPDVSAAEHQVVAAIARISQAEAARMPDFKLSGSLGLNALTMGAMTGGATLVSSLLAGVTFPVFDGGAASAQVRAQQAAMEQARLAYQVAVLTALKEVEDALVALRGNRERLERLKQAAEAAANASLMARQRYSSGLVDFQVVLETQRTQFSTEDNVASASTDLSADHVRLYKALGGGWLPEQSPPSPSSQANVSRNSLP